MVVPLEELVSTIQLEQRKDVTLSVDSSRARLTPFVKWAGGKASLIRHLLPFVPSSLANYYEPFLGGGAIFLAVCGRDTKFNAFLSDTNPELINSYKMVKSKPSDLIRSLSNLRRKYRSAPNKEDFYYEIRAWEPTGTIERAARFIFLNKTCYNGLYRVNPKGEFNVPFGHHVNPKIFDENNIEAVSKALRETRAILRTIDYRKATATCQKGDFVYFDPPYHPSSETSSFTDYTPKGFREEDQKELSRVFANLVKRGCRALLSNSNTRLVRELYVDYNRKNILVNRPINCVGSGRKGFKEIIVVGQLNQTSLIQGRIS